MNKRSYTSRGILSQINMELSRRSAGELDIWPLSSEVAEGQ